MDNVLGVLFQDIADAIRAKTGGTDTMKPNEFPTQIAAIETGGGAQPQLNAPSISRSGVTVTITNPSSNGNFVKSYNVYDGDNLLLSQTGKTLNISNLAKGEHLLTATALGENFVESAKSAVLNASKYSVSVTLANLTSTAVAEYAYHGDSLTITLTAAEGYNLPAEIIATMGGNADGISYAAGVITIASVTGDVVISAEAKLPSMANDSWATIVANAKSGNISYNVGDEKPLDITYSDGTTETVTAVLVGVKDNVLKNYDDNTKYASMTFIIKEVLNKTMACNSSSDKAVNIHSNEVNTWLNSELLQALPQELQDGLMPTSRTPGKNPQAPNGPQSSRSCKLWIPSAFEVNCTNVPSSDLVQIHPTSYPVVSPIKCKNGTEDATTWWTSSQYYNNNTVTIKNCIVSTAGNWVAKNANEEHGVAYAVFCL